VLSLRQAEVLRAVMVTGSIAGAARMLNIAAPGISRMVKHIEASNRVTLFTRSARGFVPTGEARAIFEDLEQIHYRLERINQHLGDARADGVADLAIGCSPGLGLSLIPAALADIRGRHPGLGLSLDVLHVEEVVPALLMRRVNLAVTIYAIEDRRVELTRIAEAGLTCLVPAGTPLAARERLSPADLDGEPLIGFERTVFQHRLLGDIFRRAGVTPTPAARVRLMSSAVALVQRGLGIAVLDAFTVGDTPPAGTVAIPLDTATRIPLFAIRDANEAPNAATGLFLAALARQLPAAADRCGEAGAGAPAGA